MSAVVWKPRSLALITLMIIKILTVIFIFLLKPDIGVRFTEKFYAFLWLALTQDIGALGEVVYNKD